MSQLLIENSGGGGGGTVTSISAGTGITLTPNPIIATGTVALTIPVTIADGGTNATSMTNTDGVVYFDGTKLNTTAVGSSGQVLTSNGTGVAPTYQTNIGTVTITGDSGGPLVGSSFTFTGGSSGLTFAGSGTTETVTGTLNVGHGGTGDSSFTAYAPIFGGTTTTAALQSSSTGQSSTGFVLTSTGASSLPTFQAPAASSISITGDSGGAQTGDAFIFTGGTTGLTFAGATGTETLGGTLIVPNGGTGANTLTSHSLLLGNGTSAVSALGAATNGQIPIGDTGSAPVLATITGGTGITVINGSGSIAIATSGGGVTWTDVTGTSQAMATNNGYVADNAGLVTLTLPTTSALGDVIQIVGKGAGGWLIAQNAGQTIHFNSTNTTTGTGGSLASTVQYNCVTLRCITANTDFVVQSSEGNITIV